MNENQTEAAVAALTELNPYHLSSMADCATPDSHTSAGAMLLQSVRDDVIELIENQDADWLEAVQAGRVDDDGAVSQIADGAPDVYTHAKWAEFVDLAAYNEDPTELGFDGSDMDKAASVCLYLIAKRCAHACLEAAAEAAGQV